MIQWLKRLISVTDSSDAESTTLGFVTLAFLVVTVKFALGGFFGFSDTSATDYGVAVTAILAVWVSREWVRKSAEAKIEAAEVTAKATVEAAVVIAKADVKADAVEAEAVVVAEEKRSEA